MAELCLIEVNNFLVGMRPKVDRARVQVIHKLTRQSGQLKNKKTNDNDAHKDKNSRKAQRLVQEVLILKKMKKQEMAKFALSNTRAFMTDIPNPETTDEETMLDLLQNRALLRVANHLEVKKTVDAFKAKHKGKEDIIKTIIEQLGKKQRIKDAKVKQKKRALEKAAKRNPNKIKLDKRPADQNSDPQDENSKQMAVESSKNSDNGEDEESQEESEEESEVDDEDSASEMTEDMAEKMNIDSCDEAADSLPPPKKQLTSAPGKHKKAAAVPPKNKRSGDMEIKTIDMGKESDVSSDVSSDEDENVTTSGGGKQSSAGNVDKPKKVIRDSFFVGGEDSSEGGESEGEEDHGFDYGATGEGHFDQSGSYRRKDSFIDGGSSSNRNRGSQRGGGRHGH